MVDDAIAERVLVFNSDAARQLVVKLAKPEPNRETKDYECHYEIVGAGINISRHAAGLDAFQSLQLALSAIGAHLVSIEHRNATALRWLDGDFGFPRP